MSAVPTPATVQNLVLELRSDFGRAIKQLGSNNKRGTERYAYEIDFTYALRELQGCPPYRVEDALNRARTVVTSLLLRTQR